MNQPIPPRPNYCEIRLSAIRHNVRRLREIVGPEVQIMAMVKANAYGHGAVEVSRAAIEAGVTWLGVATTGEGMELRQAGIAIPILNSGFTPAQMAETSIACEITMTVYDFDLAQAYGAAGRALGRTAKVHVKVDTGMGRLGVPHAEAVPFTLAVKSIEGLEIEGLFTHFSTADSADPSYTLSQLARFNAVIEGLRAHGVRPPLIHAANSAAALTLPASRFNLIRPGIALYGLHPSHEVRLPADFQPALSWKALISQVKTLPPGHPVSYGNIYRTKGEEKIAVLPAGYGDGLPRTAKHEAIVAGRRAPVVGRVCMDQMMVNVTGVPDVKIGDEAVLLGEQAGEVITAEEVARRWGTINYEVTTRIMVRVPRIFIG